MMVTLIDLQFPFILAYLGKTEIAETLGGLLVTEIIGVFLVYCCKSFFETKEEKKQELQNEAWKQEIADRKAARAMNAEQPVMMDPTYNDDNAVG